MRPSPTVSGTVASPLKIGGGGGGGEEDAIRVNQFLLSRHPLPLRLETRQGGDQRPDLYRQIRKEGKLGKGQKARIISGP